MTPSDDRRRERRFPRLVVLAVPVVALGVSAVLVNLAWRSSSATRQQAKQAPAGAVQVAGKVTAGGTDPFVSCTDCHKDLDKRFDAGAVPGLLYRHKVHFAKGVSDCALCHPANTHAPDQINKPTMARCFMCHGTTKQAMAPGKCETCHPANFPKKPASHNTGDWVLAAADQRAGHGQAAKAGTIECGTCHEATFCSTCHGLSAMPHPSGWKDAPHAQAFFEAGAGVCQRCHARSPETRDFCDTCHHPKGPPDTPWRRSHPSVVKADGASTCFRCHEPATCAHCHVTGQESFDADKASLQAAPASPPTTPTTGRSP